MPKLKIVAVRDRAAEAFMRPFFVPSIGVAIRSFGDEINREALDNPMFQHPDDYDLYLLGEYDEDFGYLSQAGNPPVTILARGKDLKTNHSKE